MYRKYHCNHYFNIYVNNIKIRNTCLHIYIYIFSMKYHISIVYVLYSIT